MRKVQTKLDWGKIVVFEIKYSSPSKIAPTSQHGLNLSMLKSVCVENALKIFEKSEKSKNHYFSPVKFYFIFTYKKIQRKNRAWCRRKLWTKMLSPDQSDSNASKVEK